MTAIAWRDLTAEEINEKTKKKVSEKFRRLSFALSKGKRARFVDREEEASLAHRYQSTGDQVALRRLIEAHAPMIANMARRAASFQKALHLLEDIHAAGIEGFIKAVAKFTTDKDARLSTYAQFYITAEMWRLAMDLRLPIRTGVSVAERRAYYRYRSAVDHFDKSYGRAPTDTPADNIAIAEHLGVGLSAYKRARTSHIAQVIPLDHVEIWSTEEVEVDIQAVRDLIESEFVQLDRRLSSRDAAIVRDYVSRRSEDSRAADVVAEKFGLTPERIRQISRAALADIRRSLNAKGFTHTESVLSVA